MVKGVLLANRDDVVFMYEQKGPPVTRDEYIKVPVSHEEKAKLVEAKGSMPMTDYLRSRFMVGL